MYSSLTICAVRSGERLDASRKRGKPNMVKIWKTFTMLSCKFPQPDVASELGAGAGSAGADTLAAANSHDGAALLGQVRFLSGAEVGNLRCSLGDRVVAVLDVCCPSLNFATGYGGDVGRNGASAAGRRRSHNLNDAGVQN